MVNEEEIEILINVCYGGWNISKKAIELYKLRNPITELDFDRNDAILIQIYKELGNDFDDKYSKTKILKKYENYYDIDDYDDGKESVTINYTKYKLDNIYTQIKKILQSNDNDNTKINEIEQFISASEV